MSNIVCGQDLHFYREDRAVLRGVDIAIGAGDRVGLLGANGVGKSTLMRLLAGSWKPSQGQVLIDGQAIDYSRHGRDRVRQRVQMVLQEPDDQIFATSVAADVSYGPVNLELPENEVRRRVGAALDATGIAHLADRVPHQLSYGQRKRVALAGALAMEPAVLLLDEPTAGLDPKGKRELVDVLNQRSSEGTAMLFSTHDVNVAVELADRLIVLVDGRAHHGGTDLLTDEAFVEHAGLELPWAPLVSHRLGRNITTPRDLL